MCIYCLIFFVYFPDDLHRGPLQLEVVAAHLISKSLKLFVIQNVLKTTRFV